VPKVKKQRSGFAHRIVLSCYLWSLKEWNLDKLINKMIFRPFKNLGHKLDFLSYKTVLYYFLPSYLIGLGVLMAGYKIPESIRIVLPALFAFIGLLMVLKAFSERRSARLSWTMLLINHFWLVLAISENEVFGFEEVTIYLSGVLVFGLSGLLIITWLKKETNQSGMHEYHGHVKKYPIAAFLFLLSALGLMGFPLSPTFIGEDLLFSHIHEDQFLLAFFAALAFVMEGIVAIRIFARLFMGIGSKMDSYVDLKKKSAVLFSLKSKSYRAKTAIKTYPSN
jgi:NADH:ubiquinone oxidoreductase subunit 5 (subunit L)/multisubunit Na+/H+ antiporter MnhA subunit